jgi:protein involved in polysaccharide export with SLBB domain
VNRGKPFGLAVILLPFCLIAGCFSSNPEDIRAFVKPYEVDVTAENYVLQPPDEIEIHAADIVQVDMQRQRIRPDGKVSFEAIGEVEVAGKTPKEVSALLEEKLADLYALPGDNAIDVRVAVYASKVFYVVGQVGRPGPRNYTGRDSLLTALVDAQPNQMAWEKRIQVVRPSATEDERPMIFEVNYKRMVEHGDTTKDVLLEEGDIVYVPPTILASFGLLLEEFISPVARAFYGAYLVQNPPGGGGDGYSPYGGAYR